jgi:hypothetical protein
MDHVMPRNDSFLVEAGAKDVFARVRSCGKVEKRSTVGKDSSDLEVGMWRT